jgi:[acyl-carrier-protein] S-malonyltransferase
VWRSVEPSCVSTAAIAGLFPGQGSQTDDLREQVLGGAPELVERVSALVGDDPFARVAESTRFAQPAIFCASVASWLALRSLVQPVALAGHSLGELSALVAAQALDPDDGLALAVRRGELMAQAGSEQPEGMLAVLGATDEQVAGLAERHDIALANENGPGQVVLAGVVSRLREASRSAREIGVRAILLDVTGAFHTPAMSSAVEPFAQALADVQLHPAAVPVISAATGRPFEDVRAELAQAILRPVRWRETMLALSRLGADTFVDFGPGTVLARLVKRNLPEANVLDPSELGVGAGREASGVA